MLQKNFWNWDEGMTQLSESTSISEINLIKYFAANVGQPG